MMKPVIKFIGIDPGTHGALAIINEDETVDRVVDLSADVADYSLLINMFGLDPYRYYVVYVEDVCGRPGQSCQANTTFMKLAGFAELVGNTLSSEYFKVKPQVWKKHFELITPSSLTKTQKKHLSIDKAKELFPDYTEHLTASKDGRAEALLIALYGKHMYEIRND